MHRTKIVAQITALFFIASLLSACFTIAPTVALPTDTNTAQNDWFTVYFSEPDGSQSLSLRGGPDRPLAESIANARVSVDVAAYDFNLWSLRSALLEAQRRGVQVRIVAESDNLDREELQQLIEAGLPVLGDRRESLMHHKFVIIDRLEVWTGSMNFTLNGAYRHNNNLVRVRSTRLAEDYLAEFEEMFVADRFGRGSPANTPYPKLTINGTPLEVYFSPEDNTQARLVELIKDAKESIHFMAYAYTADEIAAAMVERARQGVYVSGVLDAGQADSNIGGEYRNLLAAGISVRLDGNPDKMHHKVIIIDQQIVITGSYNFSRNAARRNDENTLVIHDPALAAEFMAEFQKVFSQAQR